MYNLETCTSFEHLFHLCYLCFYSITFIREMYFFSHNIYWKANILRNTPIFFLAEGLTTISIPLSCLCSKYEKSQNFSCDCWHVWTGIFVDLTKNRTKQMCCFRFVYFYVCLYMRWFLKSNTSFGTKSNTKLYNANYTSACHAEQHYEYSDSFTVHLWKEKASTCKSLFYKIHWIHKVCYDTAKCFRTFMPKKCGLWIALSCSAAAVGLCNMMLHMFHMTNYSIQT